MKYYMRDNNNIIEISINNNIPEGEFFNLSNNRVGFSALETKSKGYVERCFKIYDILKCSNINHYINNKDKIIKDIKSNIVSLELKKHKLENLKL